MANIIGEPIEKFVAEQIKLRQKASGAGYNSESLTRDNKILNYLNNKNAWIKLASGVELFDLKKYLLAKNEIDAQDAQTDVDASTNDTATKNAQTEAIKKESEKNKEKLKQDLGKSLYNNGTQRLKDLQKFSTDGYFTDNDIKSLDGINLAKKYVLFNTVQEYKKNSYINRSGVRKNNSWSSSQNKLYGGMGSNERGLQPVPGITNIDIETINRGSIKKATVNLKAFNKFQFGIIEILYLRLGYTMMLEYGWDKHLKSNATNQSVEINDLGSTIIEKEWFQNKSYTQREMSDLIDDYQIKYSGNYNGFFGKVNNFSWKLNKDNTYDITINLISMGGVIESLQVAIPSSVSLVVQENFQNQYELTAKDQLGEDKFNSLQEEEMLNDNLPIALNAGTDKITNFCIDAIVNMESYMGSKNGDYYYSAPSRFKDRYFIKFGHFLDFMEDQIIGNIVNNNTSSPRLEIDTNKESTLISYIPNLIPLRPDICLFQPKMKNIVVGSTDYFRTPAPPTAPINGTVVDSATGKLTFPDPSRIFKINEPFAVETKGVYYGKLMNVYLNVSFIIDVLNSNKDKEDNLNLYSFIESITDGINKSMGNSTKITPSIKNNNIIYFIDENPIQGGNLIFKDNTIKSVPLNLFGYNPDGTSNFVKDFGFQTKITPKTLNQISIGATAGGYQNSTDAVGYKWWNRGLKNRFEEQYEINGFNYKNLKSDEDTIFDAFKKLVKRGNKGEDDRAYRRGDGFDLQYFGYRYYYKSSRKIFYAYDYPGVSKDKKDEENFKDASFKAAVIKFVRKVDAKEANKKKMQNVDKDKIEFKKYENILQSVFSSFAEVVNRTSNGVVASRYFDSPYLESNEDVISGLVNSFKAYRVALMDISFKKELTNSNQTGFIPVELSFTSEGLSGWKIYNKLDINQRELPASYPSALKFVIRGLKDKISGNTWETSIDTISLPASTTKLSGKKLASEVDTIGKSNLNIPPNLAVSMVQGNSLETQYTDNGLIYYPEETNKTQVVLHHTAGNRSAAAVINSWRKKRDKNEFLDEEKTIKNKNFNKGWHISTHFIIDRDGSYDQLFPLEYWGNHIGIKSHQKGAKNNKYLQKHSIGIELESMGYLSAGTGDNKGKYYQGSGKRRSYRGTLDDLKPLTFSSINNRMVTWADNDAQPISSITYDGNGNQYRGYSIFQAYTDAQMARLFEILQMIQKRYPNIPMGINSRADYLDLFPKKDEVSENAINKVPGIYTHNSYRPDKIDIYPANNIVSMLGQRNNFNAATANYKAKAGYNIVTNFGGRQNIQDLGFKNKTIIV